MKKKHNKPLEFETHAIKRMAQRGITQEEVESCVYYPQHEEPSEDNRLLLERTIFVSGKRKGRLVVVIEESRTIVRVISCWWI